MSSNVDRCSVAQNSVFCEFKTKSTATAFLAADPKPAFEGKELLTMSKYALTDFLPPVLRPIVALVYPRDAYVTKKSAEKGFPKPNPMRVLAGNMRKGFNAFTLMEEEAKKVASKGKGKTAATGADGDQDEDPVMVTMEGHTYKVRPDGTVDAEQIEYPKGRVIRYVGGPTGNLNFKAIKVIVV